MEVNKKPDMNSRVPLCAEKVAHQRMKEKELVPLRINANTTILVKKDNQTSEYRDKWIKEHCFGMVDKSLNHPYTGKEPIVSEEDFREAVDKYGIDANLLTKKLGVSRSLVYAYIKKYGLREKKL